MGGRGKVVRNAVSTGHRKITNSMRRTPSIGQGIEGVGGQGGPNPGH